MKLIEAVVWTEHKIFIWEGAKSVQFFYFKYQIQPRGLVVLLEKSSINVFCWDKIFRIAHEANY